MNESLDGQRFNPYRRFHNAWVPAQLLDSAEVSDGAKLLYGLLRKYAGKDGSCFPLQRTLARNMGRKTATIRKYVAELKRSRLIVLKQRGKGRSARYEFLWKSCLEPAQMILAERDENHALPAIFIAPEEVHGSGSLTTTCSSSEARLCENQRQEALEQARGEQKSCAEYLQENGRDPGAWQGLEDWLMEEALVLSEASNKSPDACAQLGHVQRDGREGMGTATSEGNSLEGLISLRELAESKRLERRPKSVPTPELLEYLRSRGQLYLLS